MRHLDDGKFWNIFYCHHPCDSYFWLTLSPQSLYKLCIDTYSLPHAHLTSRTLVRLTFINYDNNRVKMKFMGRYWFLHFVQKLGSYNRWLLKVIISIKSWSGSGWAVPCLHPPSLAVYLFTLHRISRTFTIVNDCNHVQLGWMPLKMSPDTWH